MTQPYTPHHPPHGRTVHTSRDVASLDARYLRQNFGILVLLQISKFYY